MQNSSSFSIGDDVSIGEIVGAIGSSGDAGGIAHLHFEMRLGTGSGFQDSDGYNPSGAPAGWVDPTDFINAHRDLDPGFKPDVAVENFGVSPQNVPVGGTIDLTWDVRNVGDADTQDTEVTGIYISNDNKVGGGDTLLYSESFSQLSPNEVDDESEFGVAIPGGLSAGTYWVYALATTGGGETDLLNNVSELVQITVGEDPGFKPDVAVENFGVSPQNVPVGGTIDLTWDVRNVGDADTQDTEVTGIYISNDNKVGGGDTLLYSESFSQLSPNEVDDESEFGVAIPGGLSAGTYWVYALATTGGGETNLLNNVSELVQITVGDGQLFSPGDDDVTLSNPGTYDALAGNDIVRGTSGVDVISGSAGNDKLYGRSGSDKLSGGLGRDYLSGGSGTDVLEGGFGNDRLRGGSASDTFVFGDDGTDDRIRGFVDVGAVYDDKIDLSSFNFASVSEVAKSVSGSNLVLDLGNGATVTIVDYLSTHAIANINDDLVL